MLSKKIRTEALELPLEERVELLGSLWDSLNHENLQSPDSDIQDMRDRVMEAREANFPGIDWDSVRPVLRRGEA